MLRVFRRGIAFARSNPQIAYTIFLLAFLPLAFLWTAQQFLDMARANQERLEKDRIGLMHDSIAAFAMPTLEDANEISLRLQKIAEQNPTLAELKIVSQEADGFRTIASINNEEAGTIDEANKKYFESVGVNREQSFIFEVFDKDERLWKAFRAITDADGKPAAFLMTTMSMKQFDALAREKIIRAYILLGLILVAAFILLIRHARIIDYTVLYKRLKEIDNMKDDFISIASHELRAPITALRWQIDLIDEQQSQAKDLASLKNAVNHLDKLVEDVLDVSRIEQGRMKLNIKNTDVSEIIEAAASFMEPAAAEKGISINYKKTQISLAVDPDRFRQIIINLLSNAIKYTKRGSVNIEITVEEKRLMIRVRDTGIGISAEDQARLFQKFFRISSVETRDIRGTGLGLWITKQLVEAMNGTIALESMKGVGSIFIVSFPQSKNRA